MVGCAPPQRGRPRSRARRTSPREMGGCASAASSNTFRCDGHGCRRPPHRFRGRQQSRSAPECRVPTQRCRRAGKLRECGRVIYYIQGVPVNERICTVFWAVSSRSSPLDCDSVCTFVRHQAHAAPLSCRVRSSQRSTSPSYSSASSSNGFSQYTLEVPSASSCADGGLQALRF